MSLRLEAVAFEAEDPRAAGAFWAGLLGREALEEPGGMLVPGDETQVGIRFVQVMTPDAAPDRLHLHVTIATVDDQRHTLERALRLGGRRRGTKPPPPGHIVYMSDAAGYDFCLIEPGNAYLDGCGPLGEVTCEGTRAGATFWRDALGWAVVWDEGEQLAIQSPHGGTKIAWDGEDAPPDVGGTRQRFDLVASDADAAVERLIDFGARFLGRRDGAVWLMDPDGGEFTVRRG